MPQWLAVSIGVIIIVVVGAAPGLYFYDWRWLQQPHTTQSQWPPSEHRPANTKSYKSDTNHQPSNAPSSIATSTTNKAPAPNLQQQAAEHRGADFGNKDDGMNNLSAWATFGATVGLLIVAGIQAYIYHRHARIMRAQFRSMGRSARSTEKAANAARDSANAASIQAKAAVNAERPFVYPSKFAMRPSEGGGDTYRFAVEFENYGKTPAFVTNIEYGWICAEHLPDEPTYHGGGMLPESVIGPGRKETFRPITLIAISSPERERLREHDIVQFIWGRIFYRDFMRGVSEIGFCVLYEYGIKHDGKELLPPGFFSPADPRIGLYRYDRYQPHRENKED
jgi:hypothetical protein